MFGISQHLMIREHSRPFKIIPDTFSIINSTFFARGTKMWIYSMVHTKEYSVVRAKSASDPSTFDHTIFLDVMTLHAKMHCGHFKLSVWPPHLWPHYILRCADHTILFGVDPAVRDHHTPSWRHARAAPQPGYSAAAKSIVSSYRFVLIENSRFWTWLSLNWPENRFPQS